MAEEWWPIEAACQYLTANYPCSRAEIAHCMIEDMLEAGSLPSRFSRSDNTVVLIEPHEWRRAQPLKAGPDKTALHWTGEQREQDRETELGEYGWIEVDALCLRAICAARSSARKSGKGVGRPPREITKQLPVLAGMWIIDHGVPISGDGKQAELERFLANKAGDQLQESQLREIAKQAISFAPAYWKAGN